MLLMAYSYSTRHYIDTYQHILIVSSPLLGSFVTDIFQHALCSVAELHRATAHTFPTHFFGGALSSSKECVCSGREGQVHYIGMIRRLVIGSIGVLRQQS